MIQVAAGAAFVASLAAAEVPRRADDFVDSIGINTHIDVPSSVYNEGIVGGSGIRHFRSNVKPSMTTLRSRLASLYARYATRVNLVTDTTSVTPVQYRDLARHAMFESVEGLNEPDGCGPRAYAGQIDNWASQTYPATMRFQLDLFNAMLADPATAGKAVLSPAMSDPSKSVHLQNIAADFVAMHSYPGQEMPTGNFLTSFAIPGAKAMAGDTPMRLIATETGYRSGTAWGDISATAAAKYVPRLYAEYFRLGVARTYLFELNDWGQYNYGLADANFVPKPAYHQLRNLINLTKDSTWDASRQSWIAPARYYPGSLDYTMTGGGSNLHHVLLQKANGNLYLLLWQEVPSYDLNRRVDISNPSVAVDLTFNLGIAKASIYRLTSTNPQATYSNVGSLRVNVPDEVVVIELVPGNDTDTSASGQVASIVTTTANTSAVTSERGTVVVRRSGSTSAALTVRYRTSGTAVSGVDYDALPGYVTIPAGATSATININPRNAGIVGRKDLVLTINSDSAYGIGLARSASVYFGNSRNLVSDFNTDLDGWRGSAGAATTWSTTNIDTGGGAMQVDLRINGVDRWINTFQLKFATPQDWTAVSKLVFRVKENAGNPLSDLGKAVYFTWYNNGVDTAGGYAVAKFPLTVDPTYRTITLDLGSFARDRVTGLSFYVDGKALAVGSHLLYFDNIYAMSDSRGVLDDFEEYGVDTWTRGSNSYVEAVTTNVDTGVQAMKWTFNATGARWANHIKVDFPLPVDLSPYSTIRIRFKEDANNPDSDVGKRIFFDWYNNGLRPNGDRGVGSFSLQPSSGYRTIEFSISEFKRESINSLFFYVDGGAHAVGQHWWYIDNITVY